MFSNIYKVSDYHDFWNLIEKHVAYVSELDELDGWFTAFSEDLAVRPNVTCHHIGGKVGDPSVERSVLLGIAKVRID